MAFPFPIGDEQYSRSIVMRLFPFCSLGKVQLLFRVALRDLLWKQLSLFTAKVVTPALPKLCRCQKPSRFDNRALAMDPLRLNAVEPGALGRQPARDDAHATCASASLSPHRLMMRTQPGFDLLTHVPGSVIPNEHEHTFPLCLDLLTQPLEEVSGHLADGTARY